MYGMLPTMATAFLFRGIAYSTTAGSANLLPDSWSRITTFSIASIPLFLIVCFIIAIVFQVFFNKTVPGRKIFALGSNEKTAGEKGISVFWYKTLIFVIAGALTGAAAIITSSQVLSATNMIGQTSNIYAILAAIIGGASFYGAKGSALGALFGALILSCMSNALVLIKADANMYYVVYAIIILILIVFDAIRRHIAVRT
jgi:ribose/xylose/arabinose/galactoside ABC-type transport system permease subunit